MDEVNYLLIMASALVAIASPGSATLAIAGAAMNHGRYVGLALALGVLTGSLFWSICAAFGLAAILHTHIWLFEILRYLGALYLLYLAAKALRSVFSSKALTLSEEKVGTLKNAYFKGLLIHLTNPKAIIFFTALYSVGVPATIHPVELLSVILIVGAISCIGFVSYAVLFSNKIARRVYFKSKVIFESLFVLFFGAAGIKLLTKSVEQ